MKKIKKRAKEKARRIRMRCFETNSSSVHSVVYSKNDLMPSELKIGKDGYIHMEYGEFDSSEAEYYDQYTKLQYLLTAAYYLDSEWDTGCNYEFKRIEDAIKEYTGAKGIVISEYPEPYIDHQSVPYGENELVNTWREDDVINFVFNKSIGLRTDCD